MKRSTIVLLMLVAVVATLAGAGIGTAITCGQSGASPADHRGSCESSDNNLQCGSGGTVTPVGKVWVDDKGVDGCSDSGTAQGRVGVRQDGTNSFIYTDADKDFPGSTGWHKIGLNGCSRDKAGSPSYNSSGGGAPCP